ncbi:MAG: xanthine dehydrogenase family protein molybdopterin-binding subunit [Beijerinckiaceae bacterium]|nr:xanthine dehydrogenase family protein molybdopterin-binding subunit [Beijerinckiaceae bacterium]
MRPTKFGIGQPVLRVEDERFITGAGHYTSDYAPAKTLHAVVLRSPHAKARFKIKDSSAALSLPGVRLVLTAAEVAHLGSLPSATKLPNGNGSPGAYPAIPLLCQDTVRHVGDAVAFIVADTADAARDAAEAIDIDWSPEQGVADLMAALDPSAPQVHPEAKGNLAYDTSMGDKAKVDAIFASAPRAVKLEIVNNRLITNYMETRAVVAEYDAKSERYTLTVTSQGVHGIRGNLLPVLKIPEDKLRVITPDVGGGFGTKSFAYREYALAAEAAKCLGRPVSWVADRGDHFQSDAHGRDNITIAEVALSKGGKFLAMRFDWIGGLGAYPHQYGPYIHNLGATMLTGPYATPRIYVRVRGVYTNTVPTDAYRGAGRPEASFTLERLVDYAARQIGMKPERLRAINFIKPSAMPYKTPIGDRVYDVGEFEGHLTRALEVSDASGFEARAKVSRKAGKLRGLGIASYIECTAWGSGEAVTMHLDGDGGVTLYSGTQSNGQGHATAYAQFASSVLDLPPSMIRVVQGDTQKVATGNGTGGSRSIPVGGVSAYVSATNMAEKLKALAADELEAGVQDLEIVGGAVRIAGTDRELTFAEIAKLPKATDEALTSVGEFVPPNATYPNGTHVVEIEIDPDTGMVHIDRYHICDDFGTSVNPILLAGQVHGGVAQGVGQALHERTVYDEDGQLLTASFMDYGMPRADNLPLFHFETRNVPSTTNPLGIKGAGEAGSIGSTPAVMNAVCDALHRAYGVAHIDLPATPQRIWDLIQSCSRN